MKKLFIVTLAVLFVAGAAYAVEYDFSGMINTRGTYLDNDSGLQEDSVDYMFYDMEFDADFKITPSDKTLIFLNMEIHDENFDQTPQDSNDKTGDDNIAFKRAYGKYTFDNGMSTTFGLMTGGAFGTAFADSGDGAYRWRVDGVAGFGAYGFILEKRRESGTEATPDVWEDAEKDDNDAYYAYWVGKFGNMTPMVLLGYLDFGDVTAPKDGGLEFEDTDMDVLLAVFALTGSAGNFGYEGEAVIWDYSQEWNGGEDYNTYGLYANVWMTMDQVKFGGYAAYGSWDDDAGSGFNLGADFYFGEGIGESQAVGTNNNGGFAAVTLFGLYVDFSVSDALSLDANVAYWMSNEDELADGSDSPWKDADGYELTGRASYKLADNVKYGVGIAYGEIKPDSGPDFDPYVRAFHKIQINF